MIGILGSDRNRHSIFTNNMLNLYSTYLLRPLILSKLSPAGCSQVFNTNIVSSPYFATLRGQGKSPT